eukprot:sb/3467831/
MPLFLDQFRQTTVLRTHKVMRFFTEKKLKRLKDFGKKLKQHRPNSQKRKDGLRKLERKFEICERVGKPKSTEGSPENEEDTVLPSPAPSPEPSTPSFVISPITPALVTPAPITPSPVTPAHLTTSTATSSTLPSCCHHVCNRQPVALPRSLSTRSNTYTYQLSSNDSETSTPRRPYLRDDIGDVVTLGRALSVPSNTLSRMGTALCGALHVDKKITLGKVRSTLKRKVAEVLHDFEFGHPIVTSSGERGLVTKSGWALNRGQIPLISYISWEIYHVTKSECH